MTLNFFTAGVESTLPAGSIASTRKMCLPSLSFDGLNGEVHGWNGPESIWHWNLEPNSLLVKLNPGLRFEVFFFGPLVIVVSGGIESGRAGVITVKVRVAGAETLPA